MSVIGVIIAIIGSGFLILVHEFGHFIVAKATGMRVEEFSIGFGRYLLSKRIGETVYGISVVPLGGYVRVTGMHKEEFQARIEEAREREAEERDSRPSRRTPRPAAGPRPLSADEIASTPLERRYYSHPFWHKCCSSWPGSHERGHRVSAAVRLRSSGRARGAHHHRRSSGAEQPRRGGRHEGRGQIRGDRRPAGDRLARGAQPSRAIRDSRSSSSWSAAGRRSR